MTREEAIQALNEIFDDSEFSRYEAWYGTAMKMAIEALSAEATIGDYPNDLISRSALMEYCSNQKSKNIDNNDIARFPSAEIVSQSEQYKKGFEDAKRAFELEYARESENMRKRNAQLEVMLNAEKAVSVEVVRGEWILDGGTPICSVCHKEPCWSSEGYDFTDFCPNCGTDMRGDEDE